VCRSLSNYFSIPFLLNLKRQTDSDASISSKLPFLFGGLASLKSVRKSTRELPLLEKWSFNSGGAPLYRPSPRCQRR
jgi:hypothetical protein